MYNWILCKNCKHMVKHLEKCTSCDKELPIEIFWTSDSTNGEGDKIL